MLFIWVAIALTTLTHNTYKYEKHTGPDATTPFMRIDSPTHTRSPSYQCILTKRSVSASIPTCQILNWELDSHLMARLYDSGWIHVWSRGLSLLQMPLLFLAVDFSAVAELDFSPEPKLCEGKQNTPRWLVVNLQQGCKNSSLHKILILAQENSQNPLII